MTEVAATPVYGKNLKKSSSPEPNGRWPWNLVCSIRCLSTTKFVQMMSLGWLCSILRQCQIWSLMLLYGEKGKTMDFFRNYCHPLKEGNLWYKFEGPSCSGNRAIYSLYRRHLCQRVYSFCLSIHPFVCLFVHSFVCDSILFVELLQSFTFKFLKWDISHHPLIRKHSYLDHRYPGGSAFSPWLLTPGSMPQCGARGPNLGHL